MSVRCRGWAVVHIEWTKVRGDYGRVGGGRLCRYKGRSVWVLLLLALRRLGFTRLQVFQFLGRAWRKPGLVVLCLRFVGGMFVDVIRLGDVGGCDAL